MARQSFSTVYAIFGRVCVDQYSRAPTRDMYARWIAGSIARCCFETSANSAREGKVSAAGACLMM
eukprot:2442333-Pleurochrysis_carterae.AAC.2